MIMPIRVPSARARRTIPAVTATAIAIAVAMPAYAAADVPPSAVVTNSNATTPEFLPANAAETPADIVVTARRRQERAQDVPIALSVISGQQLAARGDYRLDQVQQLVPSLQVFSFNPRNTNINIRGLGSNVALTNDGLENGVGLYIDNVYYGRVGQSQFDLVDLDRIEVLRGPQGTLFGKNTTAGAINITTRLPSFTAGFEGQADIGNYDFRQLRGSLTGPLIDGLLAARLSVSYTDRGGFLYDTTTHRKVHDYTNFAARGQLLFTPAANLSVRIIGDYSRQEQDCCINVLVGTFDQYDNGATIANNFNQRSARLGYTPLPFDPFARRTDANSPFRANMNTWGASVQADYDLGGVALTSVTALRNWNWHPLNDGDYTARSINLQGHIENFQRQFSQELRIASTGQHTIDYVAGLYYFWQVVRGHGKSEFGSDAALALYPNDDQRVANVAANGLLSAQSSDPHTRSAAAFGQATWHFDPRLSLTVGLRYTHENKWGDYSNQRVFQQDTTGLTPAQITRVNAIRAQLSPLQSFHAEAESDSVSGLATLGWRPTSDVLLYATYSRGAKSQGLNLTTLPAGVSPVVDPEVVNNYEIGLKSQFLDRTLTFNLAGFQTDVSNYQTTIVQQVVGTNTYINYIANIPQVRSRGFEADLAWQANRAIGFTGSLAYTDARYVDYPNGPTPVEALNPTTAAPAGTPSRSFTGQRLAGVPAWSAALGSDIQQPLSEGVQAYAHADYSWRSSYYTVSSNSRYGLVPGYDVVNARIGVRAADGRWDLSVWARNLLDTQYYQTLSVLAYGLVTATLGDPRTVGATVRTRF